jgi:hypothetical protein
MVPPDPTRSTATGRVLDGYWHDLLEISRRLREIWTIDLRVTACRRE